MAAVARIDTETQSLVLSSDGGVAEVVYWGAPLPGDEDLHALLASTRPDITGGMLDETPPLSLCPELRQGFPGQAGLVAYRRDREVLPRFRLEGRSGLTWRYRDAENGLTLEHRFDRLGHGLLSARTLLRSTDEIAVHWLSAPVLPGPQAGLEVIDFSGRWLGEFRPERTPWRPGAVLREARGGRSGHEHPPFAIFPEPGTRNTQGRAYAMHLAWSGGHRMVAEELADGRRQIQWGATGGSLPAGTEFRSPPLVFGFSDDGLNGLALAFQRWIRALVPWPAARRRGSTGPTSGAENAGSGRSAASVAANRPVHYNCWEAVYFDHDPDTLKSLATRAHALGVERFVLDDGWFGRRDDDRSSLGDWVPDTRKWPYGLTPFVAHLQSLGLGFGLWVEPEMVNLDSDLARAHPDWILGDVDQIEGRHQRVLDLSQEAVRDHLFARLDALLRELPIDYLKWDHNRLLPAPDARQCDAIYALIDRLRDAHPHVEIESCASGGGRIDAGILARTHRVWLSDSNDALERLRIQHDAALFLPGAITGSHVGPRRCHTSGRVQDIRFRAYVAAQRHLGIELDPRELTHEEAAALKDIIAWWKSHRHWLMLADILRLDSDDPAVVAELQLSQDRDRFILFAGQSIASTAITARPLRLTALEPGARYEIRLVNADEVPPQSRGPAALKRGPLSLSGAALMQGGIRLPWSFPSRLWVVEGRKLAGRSPAGTDTQDT